MNKADILVSGATGRPGGAAIDTVLRMGKRIFITACGPRLRAGELETANGC